MHTKQIIALGFSNNVDHIITMNSLLLQESVLALHIHSENLHFYTKLQTEKEVICTLLLAIQQDNGGERFVDNPQVLEQLSDHFSHKKSVGGTAARAANMLAQRKIGSLIHCVSYTDEDKQLLDPLIEVVSSNYDEKTRFHCILQYNQGVQVQVDGQYIVAKQSNRLILNNNLAIESLLINPVFYTRAQDCCTLLISGLNAVHDVEILENRLLEIGKNIATWNKTKTVIYEDGCFHMKSYRMLVIKLLCPHLSIYSMNEEEWRELVKAPFVSAEQKIEALIQARKILGVPTVIVHTQAFVMACGADVQSYKKSLQEGVDFATCHLLDTSNIPAHLPLCAEGLQIQELCQNHENLCCVPSYAIDKETLTTVGLGDAFIAGFLSGGVSRNDQKRIC